LAESRAGAPLKSQLAAAVRGGASVIVAMGTVTRKSATAGAPARYAVTLRSVQTLRGPAVAPGSTAWTPGPAPGAPANPVNGALLAPGGRLFAIVWPKVRAPQQIAMQIVRERLEGRKCSQRYMTPPRADG
jgi:hypothetical protein